MYTCEYVPVFYFKEKQHNSSDNFFVHNYKVRQGLALIWAAGREAED